MSLHLDVFGSGPSAVFVHGSFGWGLDTFPRQRDLADAFEVVLVDRHGFGRTPDPGQPTLGWPLDDEAVAAVMAERGGVHLVGQSYGAVISLLAASRRPDLVRSLVVIEPPLFGIVRDHPSVSPLLAALGPVAEAALDLSCKDYLVGWAAAVMSRTPEQVNAWTAAWSAQDWAAADASRRERWPGDAPVDFDKLRSMKVPKVVVAGGWPSPKGEGPSSSGMAFRAVADELARRIDAHLVVFPQSAHNPQIEEADDFNLLLRRTWGDSTLR